MNHLIDWFFLNAALCTQCAMFAAPLIAFVWGVF